MWGVNDVEFATPVHSPEKEMKIMHEWLNQEMERWDFIDPESRSDQREQTGSSSISPLFLLRFLVSDSVSRFKSYKAWTAMEDENYYGMEILSWKFVDEWESGMLCKYL